MIIFVLLHVLFGVTTGAMVVYLPRASSKAKAWAVWILGILFSFVLVAIFGEFTVRGKVEEGYGLIASVAVTVAFFSVLLLGKKYGRK